MPFQKQFWGCPWKASGVMRAEPLLLSPHFPTRTSRASSLSCCPNAPLHQYSQETIREDAHSHAPPSTQGSPGQAPPRAWDPPGQAPPRVWRTPGKAPSRPRGSCGQVPPRAQGPSGQAPLQGWAHRNRAHSPHCRAPPAHLLVRADPEHLRAGLELTNSSSDRSVTLGFTHVASLHRVFQRVPLHLGNWAPVSTHHPSSP